MVDAEPVAPPPARPWWPPPLSVRVLIGLLAGLVVGALLRLYGDAGMRGAAVWVEAFGGLWLNAFRMTVVPLVFALLVTGVAATADAAATGRLAARAVGLFSLMLLAEAIYAPLAAHGVLALFPLPAQGAEALRAGVSASRHAAVAAPDFTEFLKTLAPSNVLKAAADDAILPLVVFAGFFGFALTRLREELRRPMLTLIQGLAEAMLVIVRWVLWAAPVGVFALTLGVGLRAGLGAAGVLAQYVATVVVVMLGGIAALYVLLLARLGPAGVARFARAAAPVQVLAVSTQSSLACLPAMVERARDDLHVSEQSAGLVLPLAVALFRFTSTAGNLAIASVVAAIYGLHPSLGQWSAAVVVAFAVSVGSVGLPGQTSFLSAVGPVCLTLGLPLDLLPLLLAIDVTIDIFRTFGNVTADLACAVLLDKPGEASRRDSGAQAG